MGQQALLESFGNIDIYLFDQILKGRFDTCKHILDVGCGNGRNLVYFLLNGHHVSAIDQNEDAVNVVRQLAFTLAPALPPSNFQKAHAEELPFSDGSFDLVISSAVLHFAHHKSHFELLLHEAWRVLKSDGFLFARLASDIGIKDQVQSIGNGRFSLPDGSERYLVDEAALMRYEKELGGRLYEPIKTTLVQNKRSMTTWCLQKGGNV